MTNLANVHTQSVHNLFVSNNGDDKETSQKCKMARRILEIYALAFKSTYANIIRKE